MLLLNTYILLLVYVTTLAIIFYLTFPLCVMNCIDATSLVTGGTCKSHQLCTSDTLSTKRPLCWICHPKTMLYNLLNKLRYSTSCGHSAVGIHTYLWYSCLILCVYSLFLVLRCQRSTHRRRQGANGMKMIYGELFDLFEEMKLLFQKEAEKYDFKDPEKVYVTCDKVIGAIKIMERMVAEGMENLKSLQEHTRENEEKVAAFHVAEKRINNEIKELSSFLIIKDAEILQLQEMCQQLKSMSETRFNQIKLLNAETDKLMKMTEESRKENDLGKENKELKEAEEF